MSDREQQALIVDELRDNRSMGDRRDHRDGPALLAGADALRSPSDAIAAIDQILDDHGASREITVTGVVEVVSVVDRVGAVCDSDQMNDALRDRAEAALRAIVDVLGTDHDGGRLTDVAAIARRGLGEE